MVFVFTQLFNLVVLNCSNENGLLMNRVFLFFALLTFISACRMVTESDAAAKCETTGGVSVVARFEYDAWGNILSATSSVPALARNRYRFQCREWSAATGLVNFRARWYDAVTGRWLSKDPIGLSGGLTIDDNDDNDGKCDGQN